MAIPFMRGGGCPRCGRMLPRGAPERFGAEPVRPEIRCGDSGVRAAAEAAAQQAAAQAALRDEQPCGGCAAPLTGTIAEELYGARICPDVVPVVCCDPVRGCAEYDIGTRSRFWPAFAHPRWLSCEELYGHTVRRRWPKPYGCP